MLVDSLTRKPISSFLSDCTRNSHTHHGQLLAQITVAVVSDAQPNACSYFGQYSLLIGAAGYLLFYCTLPMFGLFPALEKWAGIGLWIISVLGAGYGLFMCLTVFISNRLPRKPPPSP